jgi:hypothetical protein
MVWRVRVTKSAVRCLTALLAAPLATGLLAVAASGAMLPGPAPTPDETRFPERAACAMNLLDIGVRLLQYAGEHEGQLPAKLSDAFGAELKAEGGRLVCPSARPQVVPGGYSPSYGYVAAPGKRLLEADPPVMLVFDGEPVHQDGRNVLSSNGEVEFLAEEVFQKRLAEQLATLGNGAKVVREEDVIPLTAEEMARSRGRGGPTWQPYATIALTAGIVIVVLLLALRSKRGPARKEEGSPRRRGRHEGG